MSLPIVKETRRSDGGFELSVSEPINNTVPLLSAIRSRPFASILPGGPVESVLTSGISQFFQLYNAALVGRIILTWFPNPPQAIYQPLATVCDPYLNLFRNIIPPLGGTIDLSPILAFVVLDLFSNSAAALPAEMGPDGKLIVPKKGWGNRKRGADQQ